jgi:cell wall-associated NlpC family hydrolase
MSISDVTARINQIQEQFCPPAPTTTPAGAAAFAAQLQAAGGVQSARMPQATGLRSLSAGITGHSVVTDARKYLGIPYLWGGTDPSKGLDCSGLVQLVYHDLGYSLPRGAADQARQGQPVARLADARPGDLLAFGSPVHHIAIYIGNGKVIEAPHTGANVRVSDVYETPTAIRRIIPAVSAASSSNSLSLLLQRAQSGLPLSSAQLSALRADLESR